MPISVSHVFDYKREIENPSTPRLKVSAKLAVVLKSSVVAPRCTIMIEIVGSRRGSNVQKKPISDSHFFDYKRATRNRCTPRIEHNAYETEALGSLIRSPPCTFFGGIGESRQGWHVLQVANSDSQYFDEKSTSRNRCTPRIQINVMESEALRSFIRSPPCTFF